MTPIEYAARVYVEAEHRWAATVGGDPRAEARVQLDRAHEELRRVCGYTRRYDDKSCRYVVERLAEKTASLFGGESP